MKQNFNNIPSLVINLRRINLSHAFLVYFSKVHFSIILPTTPRPYKCFLAFIFFHRIPVAISLRSLHATFTANLTRDLITRIIIGEGHNS